MKSTRTKKKKTKKPVVVDTICHNPKPPKLSDGLYWEFRCTIEEQEHLETKIKLIEKTLDCVRKVNECNQLLLILGNRQLADADKDRKNYESSYNEVRKKIEDFIGFELKNCEIDPITFEVKRV